MNKSLGQIAYEAGAESFVNHGGSKFGDWQNIDSEQKQCWEDLAYAVAKVVRNNIKSHIDGIVL